MKVEIHIQVTPEAKKKAVEAKSRGHDAFKQKDYHMAIDAYTQVHYLLVITVFFFFCLKQSVLAF